MSWAVNGTGKPKALIEHLSAEFDRVTCGEPEQTIKAKVRDVILFALENYPADSAVKITASGSQARDYLPGRDPTKVINSLRIEIEPLWGFIE